MASSTICASVIGGGFRQRCPCLEQKRRPQNQKSVCSASANEGEKDVQAKNTTRKVGFREAAERDMAIGRRSLIKWGAMSVIGTGCACCFGSSAKADSWGYEYDNGPMSWGGVCMTGGGQSPIDIKHFESNMMTGKAPSREQFSFCYRDELDAKIFNSGHGTMQVNFPPGQSCHLMDRDFELIQFHFHTPSEHSMDGERSAMEVHLVHKDRKTGTLAVLGSLMNISSFPNQALATALSKAPMKPATPIPVDDKINLMKLLPLPDRNGHRPFYHYVGSLTTPPCSEKVDWFVFRDPVNVSAYQVLNFEAFLTGGKSLGRNSRPIQDLRERKLTYFEL